MTDQSLKLNPIKINNLTRSITTILLSFFLLACSSDDGNNDNNNEPKNSIAAPTSIDVEIETGIMRTWQVLSITEDGAAEEFDECDKQETISFSEANSYFSLEADSNEEPCGLTQYSGSYELSNTSIDFEIGSDSFTKSIIGLNETGLVLRENYNEGGQTFVYVETYKKLN